MSELLVKTVFVLQLLLLAKLITAFRFYTISLSDDFCQLYSTDIDIERLRTQLSLLPDLLCSFNEKEGVVVHKVTSIRTVIDLMNSNSLAKTLLNQVDKLLRIYLTIPLSTSTAERAFSTL